MCALLPVPTVFKSCVTMVSLFPHELEEFREPTTSDFLMAVSDCGLSNTPLLLLLASNLPSNREPPLKSDSPELLSGGLGCMPLSFGVFLKH
uniref:Uncharacterized protein n=1 Tax=Anguilla anguilla TaxID=7936 RepID=A0A0E9XD54_ANGAN